MKKKDTMLLGSILADSFCLGAHWIYDQEKIREEFGIYDRIRRPLKTTYHKNRRKGDHTHIGEQTLMLLAYMAHTDDFNLDGYRSHWVSKMEDYDGYIDHATKSSLLAFERGETYGSNSEELAGGARMAAILYHYINEREKGIKYAIEQGSLTHNSNKSIVATEYFARAIYEVLDGIKPSIALEKIAIEMDDIYILESFSKAKEVLSDGIEPLQGVKVLGQTCSTDQALPSIIYLIMLFEEDYREAMIANVMAGGDSASRGLILGMLIGAYREDTIPHEWVEELKEKRRDTLVRCFM